MQNTSTSILLLTLVTTFSLMSFSCGKKPQEGVIGNYYSVTIKAPKHIEEPTFHWNFIRAPENSHLSYVDLIFSDSKNEMTFSPDQPGEYEFEATIYNSKGDEKALKMFSFMISEPIAVAIEEAAQPPVEIEEYVEPEPVVEIAGKIQEKIAELYQTGEIPEETEAIEEISIAEEEKVVVEAAPEESVEKDVEHSAEIVEEEPSKLQQEEPPVSPAVQKKPVAAKTIPKVRDQFTIQYSSRKTLRKAQEDMSELLNLGIDAYIQKAYFLETDELWYRVRIGIFHNSKDAEKAAKEIKNLTKTKVWVDHVRLDS